MSFFQNASGVAISGETQIAAIGSTVNINHGGQAGSSLAFKDLSAAAAHAALHDSAARFNAPRCHRNTRAKYRDQLELWMLEHGDQFTGKQLIWLHGGAGAGKSAIMQSVVEQCTRYGSILGSFFFSRADSSRNYAEVLIPTLAYQLASAFPEAMTILEPIIKRNPLIFKVSLNTQALELLVRPLQYLVENGYMDTTSPHRRVFVIDGLDECNDPQKQALIIHLIASILCDHHVPICFLIASRPELAISFAFEREKKLRSTFTTITLENDDDAQSDIRQYIGDCFLDILDSHPWRIHIELPWPDPNSIDDLVRKSSGHFIYAATAMRFIASSIEHPGRALKVVQGLEPSRTGAPFAELDELYTHIITSAQYSKDVLKILRHCYLSNFSHTVSAVCFVHNIAPQDVALFLSGVQSLVSLSPDNSGELHVAPKHASLGDFLMNEERSQVLYISGGNYHSSFLARYYHFLDTGPRGPTPLFYTANWRQNLDGLILSLSAALEASSKTDSLRSLVSSHTTHNIWNFCLEALKRETQLSTQEINRMATSFIGIYLCALRDSVALNGALYTHQAKMYIQLALDNISGLVHQKPQYRVIPALIFSSCRSGLSVGYDLMFLDDQFDLGGFKPSHIFYPLKTNDKSKKIDPRVFEAIKQFPQSQMSWSSDLADAMKLVLQHLVHLSGAGPSVLRTTPHRQWLRQHKCQKQISLGSPRLSSAAINHRFTEVENTFDDDGSYGYSEIDEIRKQKQICRALLKAVIYYLRKSDCIDEVVLLARKSLPIVALWFPKLFKSAHSEMDAYVHQWEDSLEGLLEVTKSLYINDMD